MADRYQDTALLIAGEWRAGLSGEYLPVIDPATEEVIGQVAVARQAD